MVTIGRPELCQLFASLNHFGVCPREGHLNLSVQTFGYVKTTLNKQIAFDSRPMIFNRSSLKFENVIPNFTY